MKIVNKNEKKEAKEKKLQERLVLQNQLNEENKGYFEELFQYVDRKNIFKDKKEVDENLLKALKEFVEAQKNGKTAKDYFDKNPEALGNEIIMKAKKESLPYLMQFFTVGIGIYLLFSVLIDLAMKAPLILGYDLINLILIIPTIYFIFWAMSKTIDGKKKWLPVVPLLVFVIFHLIIPYLIPPFFLVANGNPVRIILLMISVFLIGGYYIFQRKAYEFFPPLIFFYVYSGLQFNTEFILWQKTTTGRIITLVLVIVVLLLMYLIGKKRSKKEEEKENANKE